MTAPEAHNDELCAQSHAEDPGPRTETERCIEARVYVPCAHPLCGGVCEYEKDCGCRCHRPGDADRYGARVNAPLTCTALLAIDQKISSGDYPRYSSRRHGAESGERRHDG